MTTLFISDLHLSHERPEKIDLFYQFISGPARQADTLYILGDLFEAWVGDDDDTPPNPDILTALASLKEHAVDLFVMHGNRDFLMAQQFEEMTHATLLDDPSIIDLYGEKTLIMHGDLLCTQDVDYLQFRRMVRDPQWQQEFLAQPLPARLLMAEKMRANSKEAMKDKAPVIMDAEQKTIEEIMRDKQVKDLIHGHTHRPAVHEFELDDQTARRTVLGDWYQNENVLVCDQNQQQLVSIQSML